MFPLTRFLLSTSCLTLLAGVAMAGDPASAPKPSNSIDPVSGKPVDASVTPAVITVKDKTVAIAVASKDDAATIAKADEATKALYAEAAASDGTVKGGKIHHKHKKNDK